MSAVEREVLPDAERLAATVATALLEHLGALQAGGRTPHVVLTGGTVADLVHREVARLAPDSSVDFADVVFWFGDERFVAPDSEDRNERQAREAFLDAVGATQVRAVPSSATVSSVEEAAEVYAATLREHGPDEMDVVMLGVGPDGHVASLFPDHPQLFEVGADAVAVRDSPKPPPERVSLTFPALQRTTEVWFLVSGEGKADAVARALAGDEVRATPAAGVRGRRRTRWWLDRAAASRL